MSLEHLQNNAVLGQRWIFLHGMMGYHQNWRRIVSALDPQDVAFIFDQRGHGKSMKPVTGYAAADYARDLFEIVQELNWTKFILVGHSMGGRNALIFTVEHPELVEKLIIEDIGPDAAPEALSYYKNLLDIVPTPFATKLLAKQFFLNDFKRAYARVARTAGAEHDPMTDTLGLYFYSNIIETEDGRADWRFSKRAIMESVAMGRGSDHWAEFESLTVPTLALRGQNSEELSSAVFDRMSRSNPNVRGIEIANAGHWIHYDQPDEFVRVIKEFARG